MNISVEPVLRLGVTIKKDCFNKKVFQDMLNIFYILSEFVFFNRMGAGHNEKLNFLKLFKKFVTLVKKHFT